VDEEGRVRALFQMGFFYCVLPFSFCTPVYVIFHENSSECKTKPTRGSIERGGERGED
jgi:hypothetical protein